MIRLGRLRIENFKSFIDPIDFDFSENNLVIFDGPNGFGKTTVFDAIEICFTGAVSRIFTTDSKNKDNHVLKGNKNVDTVVYLELLDGEQTEKIIGFYIPANIAGKQGQIKYYTDEIKRFQFNDWPEKFSTSPTGFHDLDTSSLEDILDNSKLKSTFTLFNYIQQEETSHFLKKKESDRHKEISYLFGTQVETEQKLKLENIKTLLTEAVKNKQDEINKTNLNLEKIALPEESLGAEVKHSLSKKIEVLNNCSKDTLEKLKNHHKQLLVLTWLLKNPAVYKKIKFNYVLGVLITDRKLALNTLIKVGMLDDYARISRLRNSQTKFKKLRSKISIYKKFINDYEAEPNVLLPESLAEFAKYYPNLKDSVNGYMERFNVLAATLKTYSKLLTQIKTNRENLLEKFSQHHHKNTSDTLHCPFCGNIKKSWEQLEAEYIAQSEQFSELMGADEKEVEQLSEDLINQYILPVITRMKQFVKKYEPYISSDVERFFEQKLVNKSEFEGMLKVKQWLNQNVEDYQTLIDKDLFTVNADYDVMYDALTQHLETKYKLVDVDEAIDYKDIDSSLKGLGLELDQENKVSLTLDELNQDKDYILYLITQKNSENYKNMTGACALLKKESERLETEKERISSLIKVYTSKIKEYEKNVAKQIAIPLFVYSSKLFQSRPEGSGIFFETPEKGNENGFVRFRSTNDDSHDAYNTMSSGQLVGVIISFMLAMNKVYPTKLGTLMIDDPVQSMDEINMASFVQMLRNEFSEQQILLSTHESKVANYIK